MDDVTAISETYNEPGIVTTQPARLPQPRGGELTPVRTSEQGRALAARRWDKYRKAAAAGLVVGVLGPDAPVTEAARIESYITLVAVQTKMAADLSDPRAPQAFRNVRQAIGADIGAPSRTGTDAPASGAVLSMSTEVMAMLAEVLAGRSK